MTTGRAAVTACAKLRAMSDREHGSRGLPHVGRQRGLSRVGRERGLWRAAFAACVLLVAGAAGWLVSDRLEADNDFCTSCHIRLSARAADISPRAGSAAGPGPEALVRPLHAAIRRDFDARPPVNLAGAHQVAGAAGAEGLSGGTGGEVGGFRCIDCHGGVGLVGRARVKALAIKDAFFYVIGNFEEPDGMHWPLQDADCRQCHESYADRGETGATRFHELPIHNVDLGVACVSCHLAHDAGNPQGYFLDAPVVRVECARCHEEYAAARPIKAAASFEVVSREKLEVPLESRP